jgi:hypothetical protein
MNTIRPLPWTLFALALAFALVFSPACDESGPPTTTRSGGDITLIDGEIRLSDGWAGEWNVLLTFRDCNTGDIVVVEDIVDVICPGDTLHLDFSGLLSQCEGIVSDSRLDISCEYEFTVGGCIVRVSFALDLERSGEGLTGSGIWSTSISGFCNGIFGLGCEQIEVTGTRLDSSPACE